MKLDLNDLKPEEATFELTGKPGVKITLKKFSLAAQIWVRERFGADSDLKGIFENQKIPEISEIAFYLIKDKSLFKNIEDFQEAVLVQKDRIELLTAMLATIGISQPIIEHLSKESAEGNEQSLSQPTGAQSSI